MNQQSVDLVIVGAGPVGLMSAYLAHLSGLSFVITDRSLGPLQVGRADALNARSLQLLEIAGLFDALYPLGKPCNTSSVWSNGNYVSRQSHWWDNLEGCFHKHFLMLGQSFVEQELDQRLSSVGNAVRRGVEVRDISIDSDGCTTELSSGEKVRSRFVIGADGSRSFVREKFSVPFEITRPQLVWAVIDARIETDFEKVPEIIVFQADTSDVAWIPREGDIDRFYVRMDTKDFVIEEAIKKVERALNPNKISFKEIVWFSQFSVKESVAEKFSIEDRVFLAGDASHIHSVNGGQGLNTGLADAFNLVWKLKSVIKGEASKTLLATYEGERKPVAKSVVETSGELVRATKYSENGNHANDYVKIVERRSGQITGMGIRYGASGLTGCRLHDFKVGHERIYSKLDYTKYSLLIFGEKPVDFVVPEFVQVISIHPNEPTPYEGQAILVRPDSYIEAAAPLEEIHSLVARLV